MPPRPRVKATTEPVRALFHHMDARSITTEAASKKSGVGAGVITNWRSGATTPRLDLFIAVCEAVGVVLFVALSSKKPD
jgi:hypothetical protein